MIDMRRRHHRNTLPVAAALTSLTITPSLIPAGATEPARGSDHHEVLLPVTGEARALIEQIRADLELVKKEADGISQRVAENGEKLSALGEATGSVERGLSAQTAFIRSARQQALIDDIYRATVDVKREYSQRYVAEVERTGRAYLDWGVGPEVMMEGVLRALKEPHLQGVAITAALEQIDLPAKERAAFVESHLSGYGTPEVTLAASSGGRAVKDLFDAYRKHRMGASETTIVREKIEEEMRDFVLKSTVVSVAEFLCMQDAMLNAGVDVGVTFVMHTLTAISPMPYKQKMELLNALVSRYGQAYEDLRQEMLTTCQQGGALTEGLEWISDGIISVINQAIEERPKESNSPHGHSHNDDRGGRFDFDRDRQDDTNDNKKEDGPNDPPQKDPPQREPTRVEPATPTDPGLCC